ncbi:MAG: C40 family peptidase [Bacteroidia bacterium]
MYKTSSFNGLIFMMLLVCFSSCGLFKPITRGDVYKRSLPPKTKVPTKVVKPAPKPPTMTTKTQEVKPVTTTPPKTNELALQPVENTEAAATKVVDFAKSHIGTPYKSGGTSKEGMDCSGLVYACYQSIGMKLPRTSNDMSKFGNVVDKEVKAGDLVFFDSNNGGKINHVGLVSKVSTPTDASFIHASSSKGVIESKLTTGYWKDKHKKTMRVLVEKKK